MAHYTASLPTPSINKGGKLSKNTLFCLMEKEVWMDGMSGLCKKGGRVLFALLF